MPVSVQEAFGLWPEGEQSPADKPHLRHSSVAAWFKAEGLTGPLMNTIKPEAERQEYRAGTHPSQGHRFRDRAQPIAQQLQEELARRGYAAKVEVTFYH